MKIINTMNLKSSVGEIWLANNISVRMKCTIHYIWWISLLLVMHLLSVVSGFQAYH